MRHSGWIVLTVLFLALFATAEESDLIAQAQKFYGEKAYDQVLELADKGLADNPTDETLIQLKFFSLMNLDQHQKALELADEVIARLGETRNTLDAKLYVLTQMEKYDEALRIALKKEALSEKKSPWDSFEIMELYLKQGDRDAAITWLNRAVERGFISFAILEDEEYRAIHDDPRLKDIVARIKEKIGVGAAAKDFGLDTLSGERFTLSEQDGKVVLIDFWATWCGPCRAEIPNLKSYYKEYKGRGFEIIGISLDQKEEALKSYLEKENLAWPIAFSGKGWGDDTRHLYGVNSIPSYWLVDRQGVLRYFGLRGERLRDAIRELLDET